MDPRPVLEIPDENISLINQQGEVTPVRLHDADTLYTDAGVGKRISGIDMAETPKITPTGGFSAGSILGVAQTKATEQVIKDYGFNKEVAKGKDYFKNREDIDLLSNQVGGTLSSFLLKHGIAQPTKYTSNADMISRSSQMMQDFMLQHEQKTPVQKARELVDDVLSKGQVIPRRSANTIEEYQDYVSSTSNIGLGQQEESIKALEQRINSPKISLLQRQEYLNQLTKLKDNYQANLNAPKDIYINSLEGLNKKGGYGTMGELGRAWDLGWIGVASNAANILQWAGDAANSKTLSKTGDMLELDMKRAARKVDISAGDRDITGGTVTNLKDVEQDFSKIFKFIGTSALQYGPQMAVMMAGSAVGGLAAGVGGSLVAPMLIGIGDVYGEMPDKEKDPLKAAAIGIPIGLVDRLGISKGALKGVDLLTKEGIEKASLKIATLKGITNEEAKTLLHKEVLKLGTDYATVVKSVAVDQLKNKQNLIDIIGQITKHAGQEAATEAVQEAMQYGGIRGTTTLDFDWKELYSRVKESAIIGGLLGGTMAVPGSIHDKAIYNQQLNNLAGIETQTRTRNSLMEQEEISRNGTKLNDYELAGKLRNYNTTTAPKSINELILPGTKAESLLEGAKSLLTNGGLFSTTKDNNLNPYIQYEGGREIAGLFDTNSVRGVYTGMSAFKRVHALANTALSFLPGGQAKRDLFNTTNDKDIGTRVMDSLHSPNPDSSSLEYRSLLDNVSNKLADDIDQLGANHGWNTVEMRQPDFLIKNQIVDPNLVKANIPEFISLIKQHYTNRGVSNAGISSTYLMDLAHRISDNMSHREMTELRNLGMLDNPVLNKFRSKNLEDNAAKMVEMISRSAVRNTIFGANGEVVANGIKKMLDKNEITKEEASQLAMNVSQLLQAFDGRMNEVKSPIMRGVQENLTFATTLVYMDTSLFANLSEVVMGALGLTPANMVKYFGLTAKETAKDIAAKLTQLGSFLTKGKINSYEERDLSKNSALLQATGHHGKINDIAFNVGANINTQAKRNMSRLMFKFNLIESVTNAARAARAAIASDEINHMVSTIAESPNENDTTRWYRDRLSYYRMDPDKLIGLYNSLGEISVERLNSLSDSDPLYNQLVQQLQPGITNFIDEFSSRPEPSSTAKIFDDHRFQLFTQFKKFTWHMSSNIIPQLWNMYLKRGTPEYTYSAFSLLCMSFATAYLGMYLKTALRGDEEKDDEKALLKHLKQAFDYSIGAAPSDVFNTISDALAERSDGSLKNSPLKTFISQSPSLNLAKTTAVDAYKVATGASDSDKSKTALIRRIPVFGEIPAIRNLYTKE